MQVVTRADRMRELSRAARNGGRRVGLVPTMGALHAGHLSLVARARRDNDLVAVSIFVNPLQFGPAEDLAAYPRDPEGDASKLRAAGVDLLFIPADGEMHPPGHRTRVEVEGLQDGLCGRSRPGHFRGVTTVVAELLAIVAPHAAYFGEKDAQQLRLIRRMVRDLHYEVEIVGCPIVREPDGLALSSRNVYLTPAERRAAPVLHRALWAAAERVGAGERDAARIAALVRDTIAAEPLARLEYVELVDDESLEPASRVQGRVLLAVAARFGAARLIDNVLLQA